MFSYFLLDTSSLMHRAYHAMKDRPTYTKDGRRNEAIFTFRTMIEKLKRDHKPDVMIAACDVHEPTWRKRLYPEYKATRSNPDAEFLEQVPGMMAVLDESKIKTHSMLGYEADDILGSLARLLDGTVVIVTGDKDIAQLVCEGVFMLHTFKNKMLDERGVVAEYGVPPAHITDYLALVGDSSDNIPGATGIGDVGAIKLIKQFGNTENIIKHSRSIKHKGQRNAIESSIDMIRLSKRLVTISTEVPITNDAYDELRRLEESIFGD